MAHVGTPIFGFRTESAEFGDQFFASVVATAGDDDARAFAREGQCGGTSDAGEGAIIIVNVVDILAPTRRVVVDLRDLVDEAMLALLGAAQHVQQFQRVVRVEIKNTPVGPSLDLARSVERV